MTATAPSSTDRAPVPSSPGARRRQTYLPVLAVLLTAALIAGCGGSSPHGGVARLNSSTAASKSSSSDASESLGDKLLRFAKCMQTHGDPDYPDPVIGSNGQPHMGGSPLLITTAQFRAAKPACYKYTPAGSATPAAKASAVAKAVKFAQCMQSHGEPNFPDPNSSGQFNFTPQQNIDTSSPKFQSAVKTCESRDPGVSVQVSGGAS